MCWESAMRTTASGSYPSCRPRGRASDWLVGMPSRNTKLTNPQIATLAVYLLGGDRKTVDTEDAAVKANALAPGRFTWRRHKEQINLELIRVFLSDAKKEAHGALIRGSGNAGWALTARGLAFAKEAAERVDPQQLAQRAIKPKEK